MRIIILIFSIFPIIILSQSVGLIAGFNHQVIKDFYRHRGNEFGGVEINQVVIPGFNIVMPYNNNEFEFRIEYLESNISVNHGIWEKVYQDEYNFQLDQKSIPISIYPYRVKITDRFFCKPGISMDFHFNHFVSGDYYRTGISLDSVNGYGTFFESGELQQDDVNAINFNLGLGLYTGYNFQINDRITFTPMLHGNFHFRKLYRGNNYPLFMRKRYGLSLLFSYAI